MKSEAEKRAALRIVQDKRNKNKKVGVNPNRVITRKQNPNLGGTVTKGKEYNTAEGINPFSDPGGVANRRLKNITKRKSK